jgi:hypothetical protein
MALKLIMSAMTVAAAAAVTLFGTYGLPTGFMPLDETWGLVTHRKPFVQPYSPAAKAYVIGACQIANSYVTADAQGNPAFHELAGFSLLANFSATGSSTSADGVEILSMARFGTGLADHLAYIDDALRTPNVKAVVYVTLPELVAYTPHPTDQEILRSAAVAERVAKDYPAARPWILKYADYLKQGPEYRRAAAAYDGVGGWRAFLNSESLEVRPVPQGDGWRRSVSALRDVKSQFMSTVADHLGGPAQVAKWIFDATGPSLDLRRQRVSQRLDDLVRQHEAADRDLHGRVVPYVPVVPSTRELTAPDWVYQAWFRSIAEMAQSKGVAFVVYLPPIRTPDDSTADYNGLIDKIRGWAGGYVTIVDDTKAPDFSDSDFLVGCRGDQQPCPEPDLFRANYLYNITGRQKEAEHLLSSVRDIGAWVKN